MAVAISATVSGVTDTIDWRIGASDGSADNKLQGDGIILVLKENVTGALAGVVLVSQTAAAKANQLTTTVKFNSSSGAGVNTSTTANIYPGEARGDGAEGTGGDAVLPEGDVEEDATAAVSNNRVSWLS